MPTTPPAPVLFSTMNCWPSDSISLGCSRRATRSVPPPGGKGEIRRTGFIGQSCAAARPAQIAASETPRLRTTRRIMLACTIPDMKAVGLYKYLPIDHPESLLDLDVETPVAAGHDLLVSVKAISVNPVDYKRKTPKDLVETTPKILGWDAAGVVEAVGPEVTLFKPGDEVYYAGSVIRQGANCEFHLVDERIVGRKPANHSFAQAASLPLTTLTAWELIFERSGISKAGANAGKTMLC